MKGTIFNIQRFSVHDGPGIRTNVFLKGCPLRCIWCHNPEGLSSKSSIEYNVRSCIGCGECASVCENGAHVMKDCLHGLDFSRCSSCLRCAEVCPSGALLRNGTLYEVSEVISEVMKDKDFYGETGGMTLSGGEPFFQSEFALEILKAAKEKGLHTAVETCGMAPPDVIKEAAEYVDVFLYDCKATDAEVHKKVTGADPRQIMENLELLDSLGAHIVLRCPIIPSINDNPEHFKSIGLIAEKYKSIKEINIMPYHSYGEGKRNKLGMDGGFVTQPSTPEELEDFKAQIEKYTAVPVVIM
ncbi:MAG: glycyl-radical enzyme activating protein [Ruminococcaceae bacterium]|nr:glycyl-radical enzyme activating protein [Oscillospiraceae bacterium]